MDDTSNFQRNYSIGEVEVEGGRIYHKSEYRERRNHYAVFAVNADVAGFDTDRAAFCGAYRGFSDPEAVFSGESRGSIAHGWQPIGSHHLRVTLAPGESKRFIFLLGYCENPEADKFSAPDVINKAPADRLCAKYASDAQFDAAPRRAESVLGGIAFPLLGSHGRGETRPDGERMAPIPVHGHL